MRSVIEILLLLGVALCLVCGCTGELQRELRRAGVVSVTDWQSIPAATLSGDDEVYAPELGADGTPLLGGSRWVM